jgi:hypothetical protein
MSQGAVQTQGSSLIQVGGNKMPLEQALTAARNSANWFWWIAGLSLINSVAAILELDYAMILGLGVTQLADGILRSLLETATGSGATFAKILHLLIVACAAGFFYLMGVKARGMHLWAYRLGMLVYTADALIFLLVGDWIGVGFHAFVLFMLWGGYNITKSVRAAQLAPAAA